MVQSTAVYIGIHVIVLQLATTDTCRPRSPVDSVNGPLTITGELGGSVLICTLITDHLWIAWEGQKTPIYNIQ